MGLIMLPFALTILAIVLVCFAWLILYAVRKELSSGHFFYGCAIGIILYIIVAFSFFLQTEAWQGSPIFRFSLVLVFVPFVASLIFRGHRKVWAFNLSKMLLVSVVFSFVMGLIFPEYSIEIWKSIDLKVTY